MLRTKKSNILIATGFARIVNGYYEIPADKIVITNIFIPQDASWRTGSEERYYVEYRTADRHTLCDKHHAFVEMSKDCQDFKE